eukprot:2444483-Prymnesium_polylepis.1
MAVSSLEAVALCRPWPMVRRKAASGSLVTHFGTTAVEEASIKDDAVQAHLGRLALFQVPRAAAADVGAQPRRPTSDA